MRFKTLLGQLIAISKKSKTDFALAMNMTPSGLSKLLNGSRTPSLKERRLFIWQAAEYFSEALYSPRDYARLEPIFPVVYDFESRDELKRFFDTALTYSLENTLGSETDAGLAFSARGRYYLGRDTMLNILCVILSEYILCNPGGPHELYASLPMGSPVYRRMLRRLRFMEHPNMQDMKLHFFSSPANLRDSKRKRRLEFMARVQQRLDIRLYACEEELEPFLLL